MSDDYRARIAKAIKTHATLQGMTEAVLAVRDNELASWTDQNVRIANERDERTHDFVEARSKLDIERAAHLLTAKQRDRLASERDEWQQRWQAAVDEVAVLEEREGKNAAELERVRAELADAKQRIALMLQTARVWDDLGRDEEADRG